MFRDSFRLPDTFTTTGKFWLQDAPDQKIPGTLEYSPSEITLTLHGALPVKPRDGANLESIRLSHVHGTLKDGYSCTLLDVGYSGSEYTFVEVHTTIYWATFLVVGSHTSGLDDLRIHSLSLQCSHLATFLGADPFQGVMPQESDGFSISYKDSPPQSYRIDSLSAFIEFTIRCRMSTRHMQASLTAEAVASFVPDTPQPLNWFIKAIWRFCDLMTLLTDSPVRPLAMQFRLDEDKRYDGWLLYHAGEPYEEKPISNAELLCGLHYFGESFAAVLDKWLGMDTTLQSCTYLFRDAHRDEGTTVDGFLNATKSLEAFSRAMGQSQYMEPAQYEKIRNTLASSIPTDADSDFRASMKKRLQFGNEFSFRKRILLLVRSLSPEGAAVVCKDLQEFADGVKDTRNYLTHYSDDPDTKPLEPKDRFWACQKLLLLMRILLFKYIGVDEAAIVARLKNHPWLSQRIALWHQHKEKA
jgi:ApeA N-terminal domain 1